MEEDIADLVENDAYLLWEVMGLAKSRDDYSFETFVAAVKSLLDKNSVVCIVKSVLERNDSKAISTTEALVELAVEQNWRPPASDYVSVLHLIDGDLWRRSAS